MPIFKVKSRVMSGLDDFGGDLSFAVLWNYGHHQLMLYGLAWPIQITQYAPGRAQAIKHYRPRLIKYKALLCQEGRALSRTTDSNSLVLFDNKNRNPFGQPWTPMAPLSAPLVRTERRRRPQSGNPDFFLYLLLVSYLLHLFCSCNWICFHFSLRVEGERDSIYRRTQEAKLFEQIVLVATNSTITHFFSKLTHQFLCRSWIAG